MTDEYSDRIRSAPYIFGAPPGGYLVPETMDVAVRRPTWIGRALERVGVLPRRTRREPFAALLRAALEREARRR